jgi:hypothetical protein
MPTAYQMPVSTELASRIGPRLWRKTILKAGHISKGGIELDVDRAYLETIVKNFNAGAKDQVQFVLGHDENPEKYRGELRGLEITNQDELVGLFETTSAGSALIEQNPRLGASVAVLDKFERADGRKFDHTLLHVAATLDPEVAGLGDWARAELSASVAQVVDLSADGQESKGDPVASLTDEQVKALLKLIEGDGDAPGADDKKDEKLEPVDKGTGDKDTSKDSKKPDTKADGDEDDDDEDDVAKTADEIENEGKDKKPELVAAGADEDVEALQLANARIDAQEMRIAQLQRERDNERFEAEKVELARTFGIPQDVVELARPLLHGTGHTLQLSAGKPVDVGTIMRKVLHELGRRYAKALDLGAEYGTADAQDDAAKRQSDLDSFISRAKSELRH